MKNVYVTLTGPGEVWWFENVVQDSAVIDSLDEIDIEDQIQLEEDGVLDGDLWELPFVRFCNLKVLLSKGDEPVWDIDSEEAEDITEKIGCKTSFDFFRKDCGLTMPLWCNNVVPECDVAECFRIELQDDEEFDPSKLVVKFLAMNELVDMADNVILNHIFYDGKKIEWEDPQGYRSDNWEPFIEEYWFEDE